ncbi:carboxypeptidase-like regulatory domain-containing protein [bacterium]|nr:carboxypeptidase-like regulatory domain-containing protein [bacterium]
MRLNAFLILLFYAVLSFAQNTVITGRVVDGNTGEPLPFVTMRASNAQVGAITDFDGYYKLTTDVPFDSLIADYFGYEDLALPVKNGETQVLDFTLYPATNTIGEVVVKPGGVNPAEIIMKRARKNKKEYNPEKIEYYQYDGYNKVQLAVDNVTDKFQKRKIFKAMEPLFDTISAFTDSSSNKVLPVFVSETVSEYYFRKTPRRTKEVILATKVQGVGVGEESYIAQVLGSTFQQYNFYENNLYILDKDFISPLSIQASLYYYFQLIDTMRIDGQLCHQIHVTGQNPKDLVFNGMIWITDSTYAIKRLNLEITKEANLNFIEKLKIQQEFVEVEPNYWLPYKTRVLIDISELTGNTAGMIGLYYNSAKNITINRAKELSFYEEKINVKEDAYHKTTEYWDSARHEQISEVDKRVYKLVDSLKNQPLVKTYVDIVEILVEGHVPMGKIELGPYHYLVGYNRLEGFRTRIGFRTSPEFSKNFMFRTYGAYGFKDEQFKYGFFADYVFNRTKWAKGGAYIKKDVELIGLTDEEVGTSALYDAFATFGTDQLNRAFTKRIWYEKELIKGYTQKINFTQKDFIFDPIGEFNFKYDPFPLDSNNELQSDFSITTVNLRGRISHKEQFIIRRNNRYSLGNLKAPVLSIDYTHGFKNVLGGDFDFDKLGLELWQFNSLGNLGTFEYTVKAYKVFGTLPYPILFIMRGNESPLSSSISYNLMDFFEFAADQYLSVDYEHQFNGIILNRVPLIKNLKWRAFVNTKAVYGTMSTANSALMPMDETGITNPAFFRSGIPYWELGYGIENIFRFIRVDFIHRMTYVGDNYPDARRFGVKFNAVLRF